MTRVTTFLILTLLIACSEKENEKIHSKGNAFNQKYYPTLDSILLSDSFRLTCCYFNCYASDSITIEKKANKLIFNHKGFPPVIDTSLFNEGTHEEIRDLINNGLTENISWDSFAVGHFRGFWLESEYDSLSFVGKDDIYLDRILKIGNLSTEEIKRLWNEKNKKTDANKT